MPSALSVLLCEAAAAVLWLVIVAGLVASVLILAESLGR